MMILIDYGSIGLENKEVKRMDEGHYCIDCGNWSENGEEHKKTWGCRWW